MKASHRLAEIVEAGWAPSELFLKRRLRRGEIAGRKVGREWRMSDDDVEAYLESLRNKPAEQPAVEPSVTSLRRRVAS